MRSSRRWSTAAAVALLMLVAGCGEAGRSDAGRAPLVAFDTTVVRIESGEDTVRLTVEVAETDEQRSYGLMDRDTLGADFGMLFVYPEARDTTHGFWMYRTRIPLDIAFLDDTGRILDIQAMKPCPSPNPRVCRLYRPDRPFHGGLEVSQGYFAEHGIEPGDRVVREGTE